MKKDRKKRTKQLNPIIVSSFKHLLITSDIFLVNNKCLRKLIIAELPSNICTF